MKVEHVLRQTPKHQVMMVDIMFVEGDPYLVSVSKPLGLTLINHLKGSRTAATLMSAISNQLNRYTSQGFVVNTILTDGEGGLIALESYLNSEGISVNPAGPGQHVPVVENKIRQIKERCRAIINTLPYTLPETLMKWLVSYSVSRLNMLPCGTRMDPTSPREIFTGRKIDFNRDLKLCFGEYVQAQDPSVQSNSLTERTVGCLVMLPMNNIEGSVKMYSLKSKSIITRDRYTLLPIPSEVIEFINKEAADQKRKISAEPQFRLRDRTVEDIRTWHADLEIEPQPPLVDQPPREDVDDIAVESDDDEPGSDSDQSESSDEEKLPLDHAEATNEPITLENAASNELEVSDEESEPKKSSQSTDAPSGGIVANVRCKRHYSSDTMAKKLRRGSIFDLTLFVSSESPCIFNISFREALIKHGETAVESIKKELQQMEDKNVWEPLPADFFRSNKGAKKISSKMFLKEKFKADGTFEKLKSRFVAGGHQQDRTIYEDLSSPTVGMTSLFAVAVIAAAENRRVITVDVPGAYLNTDIEKIVYMKISKDIAAIMVEINPGKYQNCQQTDGSIIVILKKALYGCVEAALLWYEHLRSTIESAGFIRNGYDRCVFNRTIDGIQTTICVYVDDLLITSAHEGHAIEAVDMLKAKYGDLSVNQGDQHSYLGMLFNFDRINRVVKISMNKYIEDIVDSLWDGGSAASPASANLFDVGKGAALDRETAHEFHSRVARILYLAKRVRPDMLLAVSFLSSRIQYSTTADWKKLQRLVRYLACTRSEIMTLGAKLPIRVYAYIDSSFAIHSDGKGQTGTTVSYGTGAAMSSSEKQRLVAKSSTEAELIGDADGLTPVLGARNFLEAQGHKQEPAIIFQDNRSTIMLANRGCSTSKRTRHINIREFWVHDRINSGECEFRYCRTDIMLADALTKPTQGSLQRWQRCMLLGCESILPLALRFSEISDKNEEVNAGGDTHN